jgi:hypothetical protein
MRRNIKNILPTKKIKDLFFLNKIKFEIHCCKNTILFQNRIPENVSVSRQKLKKLYTPF